MAIVNGTVQILLLLVLLSIILVIKPESFVLTIDRGAVEEQQHRDVYVERG